MGARQVTAERHRFAMGDACRVTCKGRKFDALVHFVSAEGEPLAVFGYDGILDGFCGWCPVIWQNGAAVTFSGAALDIVPREVAP